MVVPSGYRLLVKDELVEQGDMWCHKGKYMRQWIKCKHFGEQLDYINYCRKIEDEESDLSVLRGGDSTN